MKHLSWIVLSLALMVPALAQQREGSRAATRTAPPPLRKLGSCRKLGSSFAQP